MSHCASTGDGEIRKNFQQGNGCLDQQHHINICLYPSFALRVSSLGPLYVTFSLLVEDFVVSSWRRLLTGVPMWHGPRPLIVLVGQVDLSGIWWPRPGFDGVIGEFVSRLFGYGVARNGRSVSRYLYASVSASRTPSFDIQLEFVKQKGTDLVIDPLHARIDSLSEAMRRWWLFKENNARRMH